MTKPAIAFSFAALVFTACGHSPASDAGTQDSGAPGGGDSGFDDAGNDAGPLDAGAVDAGPPDAGPPDGGADLDLDGLADAYENRLAAEYLPYLAVHPADGCKLGGIVFRARKHPLNPALVYVLYDHLFQTDCGLTAHPGDNEAFGVTINPAKPAPAGITAMKAISHQGTACEKTTRCGTCNGLAACELGTYSAGARPLVFSSKDKHGTYVSSSTCNNILSCLDVCAAAELPGVPLLNVGEPGAHLVQNLTTQGFIKADAGWTEASLYDYDPWDPATDFGSAGLVSGDSVDPAFESEACP